MANNQKKIMHIIPPVQYGGGETILHALATMGIASGLDERICCLYKSVEFERVLAKTGVPFYRLTNIELDSGPSRIRSKLYSLSLALRMPKLLRIIRGMKPDVVHLHGFPSNLLGAIAKPFLKGLPVVYTHHWVSAPKGFVERWVFDRIFASMDFVTGVSVASVESLLKDHPELRNKSAVVFNFASKDFFEAGAIRSTLGKTPAEVVKFVNVARFAPFKNQIAVVEAVQQLAESERSRIKVVFVGDGETLPLVKARVNELGLDSCFEFKGFVPHAEVAKILGEADVLVFPSINEGFGIAVAEGLAAGLPVLGLRQCAPVVEVASNAGIFVEETGLVDGIRQYLQEDLGEWSQKALLRSRAFDAMAVKQGYLAIYQQLKDVV